MFPKPQKLDVYRVVDQDGETVVPMIAVDHIPNDVWELICSDEIPCSASNQGTWVLGGRYCVYRRPWDEGHPMAEVVLTLERC